MGGIGRHGGRFRGDSGFTLIELLTAMPIGLVVLGAVMGLVIVSLHVQKNSSTRAVATQEGTAILRRIDREIRDARQATVASLWRCKFGSRWW